MRPNRCGVCALTTTSAAPGLRRRYSSAISSAGTLSGTMLHTSRKAVFRSASSASFPPSSRTLGFCIFVSLGCACSPPSADEAYFAAGPAARVGRGAGARGRGVRRARGHRRLLVVWIVLVARRLARPLAAEDEELQVARVVELVVRR